MKQQPSWPRFFLYLAELLVLLAALGGLQLLRLGPWEGSPFFWQGLVTLVAGVSLISGIGHAALGMAKARSTDPDKYEEYSDPMPPLPM
ncbi:hypothetical protein [Kineosporia babensis]|uniref:Uncharacterized protein n=1 Tax=Kineosporia babensis TaxID=499548 RepID=A0A9X1N9C3_9ACTN|nr:hypothetical protein [Kineosporia babensis]MCD5309570.1 hypothetical protein [Kineosporia babensis]